MKKIALIGLVVLLSSGCCRGWLPIFRGAPCGSNCGLTGAAPTLPVAHGSGCGDCPTGASYGNYETPLAGSGAGYESYPGEIIGGTDYYGGNVINQYPGGQIIEGAIVNPSMSPLPQPAS